MYCYEVEPIGKREAEQQTRNVGGKCADFCFFSPLIAYPGSDPTSRWFAFFDTNDDALRVQLEELVDGWHHEELHVPH